MSNGQEEIARLEAATEAFEQIITTEESSVDVPNVGTTPSLKKRVDDRFNEQYSGQVVYMQSANSDVDEYGYPLRTLYKNGDGMTVYYPEYSVFRKDGGSWKRIDPHVRNVVSFNGSTQYATAPPLSEIDFDAEDFGLEVEWNGYLRTGKTVIYMGDGDGTSSWAKGLLCIYRNSGTAFLALGGQGIGLSIGSDSAYLEKGVWSIAVSNGTAKFKFNGEVISTKSAIVGSGRITSNTVLEIGRGRSGSGGRSLYYQGELSDLRIWAGGDRNTGTLIRHHRLDEGWRTKSTVMVNYASDLGEELVVNGTFDTDLSDWDVTGVTEDGSVEWDSGAAHMTSIGSSSLLLQQYNLSPDTNYIWKASFDVNSGAIIWGQEVAGTLFSVNISSSGDYERAAPSISNRISFKRSTGGTDLLIDNVSVRQADGYGEYVGLTEASWTQETV